MRTFEPSGGDGSDQGVGRVWHSSAREKGEAFSIVSGTWWMLLPYLLSE